MRLSVGLLVGVLSGFIVAGVRAAEPAGTGTSALVATVTDEKSSLGRARRRMQFPATVQQIVPGAGGKYLVAYFYALRQAAIIDVARAEIVHTIPMDDREVRIAAGNCSLIAALGMKRIFVRWNLETGVREAVVPYTLPIGRLALGCRAEGPLLAAYAAGSDNRVVPIDHVGSMDSRFFDLRSFKPLQREGSRVSVGIFCYGAAEGKMFVSSFDSSHIHRIEGNKLTEKAVYIDGWGMPTSDGAALLSPAGIVVDGEKPIDSVVLPKADEKTRNQRSLSAAPVGNFFLKWMKRDPNTNIPDPTVTIHRYGDDRTLATLTDLELPNHSGRTYGLRDRIIPDEHQSIFFLPPSKAIATLGASRNELLIQEFDLDQALKAGVIDYFYLVSGLGYGVPAGKPWTQQFDARSSAGPVRFTLESGPPGATMSPEGLFTWPSPTPGFDGRQTATIRLSTVDNQEQVKLVQLYVDPPVAGAADVAATAPASTTAPSNTATPSTTTVASAPAPVAPPPSTAIVEPALDPAKIPPKVAVRLAEPHAGIALGGGGRYIIVWLKSARELAMIGVTQRRIVRRFPLDDDELLFAAGRDQLVILKKNRATLSRYSLTTGERLLTVAWGGVAVAEMRMGCDSQGPVAVRISNGYHGSPETFPMYYDLTKLSQLGKEERRTNSYLEGRLMVSADGRLFCGSKSRGYTLVSGARVTYPEQATRRADKRDDSGFCYPNDDGTMLYQGSASWFVRGDKLIEGEMRSDDKLWVAVVPAVKGPLVLGLKQAENPGIAGSSADQKFGASIYMQDAREPFIVIRDLDLPPVITTLGHETPERLFFIPTHNVIALVGERRDEIVFHRLDLDAALSKSEVDYLAVTSVPPPATPGAEFAYPLEVKSKRGGLKFKIVSGPPQMIVDGTGKIIWSIPAEEAGTDWNVRVAVTDAADQTAIHTFLLRLGEAVAPTATGVAAPTPGSTPAATAAAFKVRTWTSKDGNFETKATFVGSADGKVTLRRPDGKTLEVAIDQFSDIDRTYIQDAIRKLEK